MTSDPRKTCGPGKFDPNKPLADLARVWSRVKARARLGTRVRLYDATRHTFATWAEEIGIPRERLERLVSGPRPLRQAHGTIAGRIPGHLLS